MKLKANYFWGHGCGSFFPHGAEDEVRHFHAVVKFYGFAAYVHAVSLRNALRGKVIVADDRVYFLCAQNAERVFFAGDRRLRGIALVPVRPLEEIADFEEPFAAYLLPRQPALPDKLPAFFEHRAPQPEAVLAVAPQLVVQPGLRLLVRKGVFVGVHGLFVLQNAAHGGQVGGDKFAQNQPLGLEYLFRLCRDRILHKKTASASP